mmetsp:Transcript_9866/g.18415  ORF Transcript_9866/g.18415 Transcript_9866/m.18415 type:complete len:374 (-) Transcript_9866:3381-4502(-)
MNGHSLSSRPVKSREADAETRCSRCHEDIESSSKLLTDRFENQRAGWNDSIMEQRVSWNFNVFELAGKTQNTPLFTVTTMLLDSYGLLDGWKLNRKTLVNFLLRVESEYLPNSYHNNTHAADVTQTAVVILESFRKQVKNISKLEEFSIIIASAVHDLGHLGVNNDFLINSKHPRATVYNDKSVNESYHISRAFEIMRESPCYNILEGFTLEEQKQIRRLMIECVLTTDMALHFDLLKRFQAQLDEKPDVSEWPDRMLLYQMLVHLADIANPSRPFHLAYGWAERVIDEFCDQGDKEAKIGLPVSPMCNRSLINMPKAQLGFISIFLKPTLECFSTVAPDFVEMALAHLELTIQGWQKLFDEGVSLPPHLLPK